MELLDTDDHDHSLPEFFKVYIRQHSFTQLLIPREFLEYMGGRRSGSAELVRSRRTWRVELVEVGKDLCFGVGWEDFVKDNLVGDGDFLFFKLHGDLTFSVVIYDESMCEVDVCEQGGNIVVDIEEQQKQNGDETVTNESLPSSQLEVGKTADSIKPFFEKGVTRCSFGIPRAFVREHSLSYKSSEMMVLRTSRNSYWEVKIINKNDMICLSGGWRAFFKENGFKSGDICKFELLDRLEMMVHAVTRNEGNLEKKVDVAASKIIPSKRAADGVETVMTGSLRSSHPKVDKSIDTVKPFFEKGVTRSGFNIPKAFVREHSLSYKSSEMMILRTSRNSYWEVKITTKNDKICLSGGWRAFFSENCFRAGDICKFELLQRLEMMVYVVTRYEGIIDKKVDVAVPKIIPSKRAAEVSLPSFKHVKESSEAAGMSSVQARVAAQLKAELEHLNAVISLSAKRLKEVKGILCDLGYPLEEKVAMVDEGTPEMCIGI